MNRLLAIFILCAATAFAQTNAAMIALRSPFAVEPKRMFAWNDNKRWELPQFDLVLRKEWE